MVLKWYNEYFGILYALDDSYLNKLDPSLLLYLVDKKNSEIEIIDGPYSVENIRKALPEIKNELNFHKRCAMESSNIGTAIIPIPPLSESIKNIMKKYRTV